MFLSNIKANFNGILLTNICAINFTIDYSKRVD